MMLEAIGGGEVVRHCSASTSTTCTISTVIVLFTVSHRLIACTG
jgi:hypothetical protein